MVYAGWPENFYGLGWLDSIFLLKKHQESGWPKYIYGVGWLEGQTCMEMAVAGWQSGPILCCADILAGRSWLSPTFSS
jgi:hypothetical protein